MPNTPLLGLPYPNPTDPVSQGATNIRALAEALDVQGKVVTPAEFVALTPVDGMRVRLLAHAGLGVVWELVFRAASPNAEKWEPVGGTPIWATSGVNANLAPGWQDLGVATQLAIPTRGLYLIESLVVQANQPATSFMVAHGPGPQGGAQASVFAQSFPPASQTIGLPLVRIAAQVTTPGQVWSIFAYAGGSGAVLQTRILTITPLRCSF